MQLQRHKIVVTRKNMYCEGEQQNIQTKFRDVIRWKTRAGSVISVFKYSEQWTVTLGKYEKKLSEASRWTCQSVPLHKGTFELAEKEALSKLTSTFSHWQVSSQPSSAIIIQFLDNYIVHIRLVSHSVDGIISHGWWCSSPPKDLSVSVCSMNSANEHRGFYSRRSWCLEISVVKWHMSQTYW